MVRLVENADVIAKTIYAASNPVKDLLVQRVHHWPGVNGHTHLMAGRPLEPTRPKHFFSDSGDMAGKALNELRAEHTPPQSPRYLKITGIWSS